MEETHKFFEPTKTPPTERDETILHEADGTLVTPRFDEVEAQVARPVVPLAGRPARGVGRRQWPIALVLISALAGGVVSLLAFRLYQQRQQTQAVATEVGGQTQAADASQSPAPEGAAAATEEQAQSEAPVVFEEFDPAKEGGAISDAAPSRPKATVEAASATATTTTPPARKDEARDGGREEAKPAPAPRAAEPKPRLVETLPAPRQVEARHEDVRRDDRAEDEDFADRRRERRRQRREQRREQRRNIDRIKDIFEGAPPS
jgi:hypothetical protein